MEEYGYGGHSIFAPSGSAMWLWCSGSLIANLLEEDDGSYEAAEGTVAHELAEQWLKTGVKPVHRLGETVVISEGEGKPEYYIEIDEVMLDYVEEYVRWCEWLEGDHFVEQKVYFTDYMPYANADELEEDPDAEPIPFLPQGGTADHVVCRPGHMIITDLKYGKGIFVEAVNNPQARLYALGFFLKWDWLYDFQTIEIRIGQPRLGNWGTWTITRQELLDFGEYVRIRAKAAWSLHAMRRVSAKGCQWCKVKATCTANLVALENLAYAEFEMLQDEQGDEDMSRAKERLREEYKMHTAASSRLTDEDMVRILEFRKPIEDWFKDINAQLELNAGKGHDIPGMKIVEGRSNRDWRSQVKTAEHLEFLGLDKSDIYETKMRSPNQVEELLRKKAKLDRKSIEIAMRGYDYKPPGKPTLVKDSDPRRPLGDIDDGIWDD
jgi:hypothetical protein